MCLSDQSVRKPNCPLCSLHHALHNQLHLQNISSQSEANVYGKLILQHFVEVLSGCGVMVLFAKQLHFLMHFINNSQGIWERKYSKLKIIGEPTRGVMTSRWIMAPALVSSQPKPSPMPWVGLTIPQFLQGADIRISQIHGLFKFGTWTVKKTPILSGHKMV